MEADLHTEDFTEKDLLEDDRPYAAWLFMGLGYQTRAQDQLDTIEVQLGVVGPAAYGQEAQDFIHDLRGFESLQDGTISSGMSLALLPPGNINGSGSVSTLESMVRL
ncbi:MAG: lipid A-modifier LpxR family protein [Candidatus Azotimanducaceae bacterium WSBS_2022_MAG_OTU7]